MERIKILFVEDEPDVRYVVEKALSFDPLLTCKSFNSGVAALDELTTSGEIFDFALLNFRLPFMTGVELHEQLSQLPGMENLVTALITGAVREHEVTASKRSGIKAIIKKPFDTLDLAGQIRRLYSAALSPL